MNKQQIINGLVRDIKESLVPQIPNMWTRRIVAGFADLLLMKPSTFDNLMERYPILDMIKCEDGSYDIDIAEKLLMKNISEFGNIPITIMGSTFTFTSSDVTDLREAIETS